MIIMLRNTLRALKASSPYGRVCETSYRQNTKQFSGLSQTAKSLTSNANRLNKILCRSKFIEIQTIPNPNSLKFLPGTKVLEPGQTMNYPNISTAQYSPLAKMLFRINGVKTVFLGGDFVTITKDDGVEWKRLNPEIFATIMDFFASGLPVVTDAKPSDETQMKRDDDEIVQMIKELFDSHIRSIAKEHGGDLIFVDFKNGVLRVKMQGSCSSSPNSIDTLKNGVQNMLQLYIPEVLAVEQIDD